MARGGSTDPIGTGDSLNERIRDSARLAQTAEEIFEAVFRGKIFLGNQTDIVGRHEKQRWTLSCCLDGLERIYEGLLVGRDERRKLKRREEIIRSIELIEEARRDLIAKVNYQYAVKNLILKIGGL